MSQSTGTSKSTKAVSSSRAPRLRRVAARPPVGHEESSAWRTEEGWFATGGPVAAADAMTGPGPRLGLCSERNEKRACILFWPTKFTFSPISSLFRQVGFLFRQVESLFRQLF